MVTIIDSTLIKIIIVRRRSGGRLELLRCGVISKYAPVRGSRVWDILSPMSRLLPRRFFASVPIPELGVTEIGTGARPAPTLGLGSGLGPWVGARVAPQQSPILRPGRSSV